MSGGSHNYVYHHIDEELCGQMHDAELNDLMKDIAQLAHDVEWYDSADYSYDKYKKSVDEFKAKWFNGNRTERLKGYVDKAVDDVRRKLYDMLGMEKDISAAKYTEVCCDCDYCMNNYNGKCELEIIELDGATECKHYSEKDYGRADNE